MCVESDTLGSELTYWGKSFFFLEEHSLNLLASFSLGEINLPHEGVGLSTTFSLGGMNSSREFSYLLVKVSFSWRIGYAALFLVVSPSLNFSLIKDLYKL